MCRVNLLLAFSQVWRYDEGDLTHIGIGHSSNITRVKVSPDGSCVVSVSGDGGILKWRYPHISGGEEEGGEEREGTVAGL